MIYYLDNNDMFLLYFTSSEVIFVYKCGVTAQVNKNTLKWDSSFFPIQKKHCRNIERYLKSSEDGNRAIGKSMVEQMLKIKIHGEIVGFGESEQGDP